MVAEGGREVGKAIEKEENKLTSSRFFHICVSTKKKTKVENLTHSEQTMFYLFLKASQGMNANWEEDVCKFMQIHLQISTYHQSLGTFPTSLCRRDWGGTEQDEGQWKCCGPSQQDPQPWDGAGCTGAVFLLPFPPSPSCTTSISSLCPGTHGKAGAQEQGRDWDLQFNLLAIILLPPIILPLSEQKCSVFWLLQAPLRRICVCILTLMFPCTSGFSVFKDSPLLFASIVPHTHIMKCSSLLSLCFSFQTTYF